MNPNPNKETPKTRKGVLARLEDYKAEQELRNRLFKYLSKDVEHEDSDYKTCKSRYMKCEVCGEENYHHPYQKPCSHSLKSYKEQSCNCGAIADIRKRVSYLMQLFATHYKAREAEIADWATGDDTGTSSNAIVRHMLGLKPNRWGFMAPSDADDRGRCIRLLKRFPEWQQRLVEMNQYPEWSEQVPIILLQLNKDSQS